MLPRPLAEAKNTIEHNMAAQEPAHSVRFFSHISYLLASMAMCRLADRTARLTLSLDLGNTI